MAQKRKRASVGIRYSLGSGINVLIYNDKFRPWGKLQGLFTNLPDGDWGIIGCLATEERCVAAFAAMSNARFLSERLFFDLKDKESSIASVRDEIDRKKRANKNDLLHLGLQEEDVFCEDLMAPFSRFDTEIERYLSNLASKNLVIDITSLPKRVFFWIVKKALNCPSSLENIIVTYTEPERYATGQLAENPEEWDALPGFREARRTPSAKKLIIGVGFESLGLPSLVDAGLFSDSEIVFLMPFPAQPNRAHKNWEFVRSIFPNPADGNFVLRRVDNANLPEVYNLLLTLGENGQIPVSFAPFGPKPVSLAMALYASRFDGDDAKTSVYYTQPTFYPPDYSIGIRTVEGQPAVTCYALRIRGQNVY